MQALVVIDLGFGDAGKGSLVDYYVRHYRAHTVVRFNGGAQAAHNGGADELAITCLDRLADLPTLRICERYEGPASTCFQDDRLRTRSAPNLAYQAQLTSTLAECRPVYTTLPTRTCLPWLQTARQIPITVTSRGLTWQDKSTVVDECAAQNDTRMPSLTSDAAPHPAAATPPTLRTPG
jgi:adenylosuccinate synthase